MTTPVDDPEALRKIFANIDALLLDFDGPVCSVFAGFPAHVVANQLRNVLVEGGHSELPPAVSQSADPFEILFHAATLGDDEARHVEAAFRALEADAVRSAKPTAGSHDLIRSWRLGGRPLAIVSNNSESAIAAYLDLHNLSSDTIAARQSADVQLLKPSPHLVNEAIASLNAMQTRCALVGDSQTDIEAAQAADVYSIGFANKPDKVDVLSEVRPTAVVTTIVLLKECLRLSN